MDDLLREFLTETSEALDVVDQELVRFEQEPSDAEILGNIFRLVHTIKGTCGFLGLPRLEALAHASETVMGKFRDGAMAPTPAAVSLILLSIDRIKEILAALEANEGVEPEGKDTDLIGELEYLAVEGEVRDAGQFAPAKPARKAEEPKVTVGKLVSQVLERELRPGEVSLDELERAFRETVVEVEPVRPAPVAAVAAADDEEEDGRGSASSRNSDAKTQVSNQSIRVNVETLENLMTMVSELVLTRNQLLEIARKQEDSEFKVPLQRLSNVAAELQEGVMKTRMQPIGNAWQKLPRIVRDLSQELGKQIELEMSGQDTELDRQVLDLIKDPLTHMVRNSADHGLETTEERRRVGKPERGKIRLSAYHEGGHIIIEVADDGRGLPADKIRSKVLERGLATEADLDKMTEAQIFKFIFQAGFSTAAAITNVSGRGVGMDVVRNNIEMIGGTIDLKSTAGKGTTFTIKIPLTLAIVSTLIVECEKQRYAIPQLAVVELVRVRADSEHRIERIKGTPVLRLRNKLLPLVHMRELLGGAARDEDSGVEQDFIVVMQVGSQTFGLVVDAVFHTEEIVVKPMSSMLRHITMFSGNTILGDGSVIMIVDPNGVAAAMGSAGAEETNVAGEAERAVETKKTVPMLLFRAGSTEQKAVPLSLVTRLEEIDVATIERSQGRELVQYRGVLMPLVRVNDNASLKSEGAQPLLVFTEGSRSMGLVVDEIVDIVEDLLEIEVASAVPGLLGSAVIKGKATEILDLGHYLPLAFEDWLHRGEMPEGSGARRILYVDDSVFFRNMLTPVLKAAGYDVVVCENGREAIEYLEKGVVVEAIVSDIEMPGMDGFELAEKVRSMPEHRNLPIIALSTICTPAFVERGRQAGFDDYVAKFDRPGLIAALKETSVIYGAAA